MPAETLPLARLLSAATRTAIDELHRALADEGHPGIRPAHGYALVALGDGASIAQLGGALGMTKQGAAKLVASLEELGYVTRGADPDDARAQRVTPTARGRDLLARSARLQGEIEARWAAAAGERNVRALRLALERVLAAVDGEAPSLRPVW